MCYMHVDVGPKNNCLKWLQLSHPVVSTFITCSLVRKLLGLVVHIAQTPVVCQERRLTYMTTWYGPGTGHKVLHLMDCARHPSNMHLGKNFSNNSNGRLCVV